MQQTEPDLRAKRLLTEFENMGNILSSDGWEQALLSKMKTTRPVYANTYGGVKPVVFVACLLLINMLLFLRLAQPDENQVNKRHDALRSISNELLIKSSASS